MNRRSLVVGIAAGLTVVGAGFAWAAQRGAVEPPAAPVSVTASATTAAAPAPASVAPSVPPPVPDRSGEAVVLAGKYVKAYKAGRTVGGELWLRQLRPLASPELVKAVALTDPEKIVNSETTATKVESIDQAGNGRVRVTFRDGSWLLLHTAPAPVAGLWVVAVEGSKPAVTP